MQRVPLNYLQTPTSITVWNDTNTYVIGIDHPSFNDVVTRLQNNGDWNDICVLIDKKAYDLEEEENNLE
jgi:hypothetical protein